MNNYGGLYDYVPMQSSVQATGNGTAVVPTRVDEGAYTALTMHIEGINGDTITFEGTIDGTNWIAIQAENLNDGTEATTATADGLYRITVLGLGQVRARISTYSAGTITILGILAA